MWLLGSQLPDEPPYRGVALWCAKEEPGFPLAVQGYFNYYLATENTQAGSLSPFFQGSIARPQVISPLAKTSILLPAPANPSHIPSSRGGGGGPVRTSPPQPWSGGGAPRRAQEGQSTIVACKRAYKPWWKPSKDHAPVGQRGDLWLYARVKTRDPPLLKPAGPQEQPQARSSHATPQLFGRGATRIGGGHGGEAREGPQFNPQRALAPTPDCAE